MRPVRGTDAHRTDRLAELVCSNSFRSDDPMGNAVGLLHEEMRRLGSLVMAMGDRHKLPAGGALAVDRDAFAAGVQAALEAEPLVTIRREEVPGLPPPEWGQAIVATGPLTSPALAEDIRRAGGQEQLAFFDAIAPIVYRESIDMAAAWFQSRYDKAGPGGTGADYINCPLDAGQYEAFIDALLAAEKTEFKEWEASTPYFEGCLPIEVMAARGRDTLALRADEARGPHRPAHRPPAACGGSAQAGQRAGHALQYRRLPDQAEAWRAGPRAADDPRPGAGRVRPAGRAAPQHLHQQPASPGSRAAAEGPPAHPLRRPDHRLRGLCRECRGGPAGSAVRRRGGARPATGSAAARDRPWRPAGPHHGRCGCRHLPADERQFRPLPATARGHPQGRSQAGAGHPCPGKACGLGLDPRCRGRSRLVNRGESASKPR